MNLFRKSNDPIKKMEQQIAEANAGNSSGVSSDNNKPNESEKENNKSNSQQKSAADLKFDADMKKHEAEVKARKEYEQKQLEREEQRQKAHEDFMRDLDQPFKTGAGVKIDNLHDLLKNSLYKFSYYSLQGPIKKRLDFLKTLGAAFTTTYDHSESLLKRRGERIMAIEKGYLVKKMNKYLFDDDDVDLLEALAEKLQDKNVESGSGASYANTYAYADDIYDYIKEGREFANLASRLGDSTKGILEKIINKLDQEERLVGMHDDLDSKHFSKLALEFQKFSTYMAKIIDYLVHTTIEQYKNYVHVAQTVTTQYCKSIR